MPPVYRANAPARQSLVTACRSCCTIDILPMPATRLSPSACRAAEGALLSPFYLAPPQKNTCADHRSAQAKHAVLAGSHDRVRVLSNVKPVTIDRRPPLSVSSGSPDGKARRVCCKGLHWRNGTLKPRRRSPLPGRTRHLRPREQARRDAARVHFRQLAQRGIGPGVGQA